MPLRRAHLWLLPLFPIILIGFWPGYFGRLGEAPFALHLHGITATLWIALVTFQAWTIASGRRGWHRMAGLALFLIVPVFVAGALLVMHEMARLAAAMSDPFHTEFGFLLALDDLSAVLIMLALVHVALARRREIALHAGALVATVLLVLPPVLARILPLLPGFPSPELTGLHPFAVAFEGAQLISSLGAWFIAGRVPRAAAMPFRLVAMAILVQSLVVETVGRSALWERFCHALIGLPPGALALAGLVLAGLPLWLGWNRGTGRRPAALAAD